MVHEHEHPSLINSWREEKKHKLSPVQTHHRSYLISRSPSIFAIDSLLTLNCYVIVTRKSLHMHKLLFRSLPTIESISRDL